MKKNAFSAFTFASAVLVAITAVAHAEPAAAPASAPAIKQVDVNKDGAVSKDEFLQRAEKGFNKADADGDGKLTRDERKALREERRENRQERREHRHGGAGEAQ